MEYPICCPNENLRFEVRDPDGAKTAAEIQPERPVLLTVHDSHVFRIAYACFGRETSWDLVRGVDSSGATVEKEHDELHQSDRSPFALPRVFRRYRATSSTKR